MQCSVPVPIQSHPGLLTASFYRPQYSLGTSLLPNKAHGTKHRRPQNDADCIVSSPSMLIRSKFTANHRCSWIKWYVIKSILDSACPKILPRFCSKRVEIKHNKLSQHLLLTFGECFSQDNP